MVISKIINLIMIFLLIGLYQYLELFEVSNRYEILNRLEINIYFLIIISITTAIIAMLIDKTIFMLPFNLLWGGFINSLLSNNGETIKTSLFSFKRIRSIFEKEDQLNKWCCKDEIALNNIDRDLLLTSSFNYEDLYKNYIIIKESYTQENETTSNISWLLSYIPNYSLNTWMYITVGVVGVTLVGYCIYCGSMPSIGNIFKQQSDFNNEPTIINKNTHDIMNLHNNQINELATNLKNLTTQIKSLENNELKNRIDTIENNLNSEISRLNSNIDVLQTSMSENMDKINHNFIEMKSVHEELIGYINEKFKYLDVDIKNVFKRTSYLLGLSNDQIDKLLTVACCDDELFNYLFGKRKRFMNAFGMVASTVIPFSGKGHKLGKKNDTADTADNMDE